MTDLSNLDNFLLEADFTLINDFIGEKLLENNTETPMNKDVRYFIRRLAEAIYRHKKETCHRKCFLRKGRKDEKTKMAL